MNDYYIDIIIRCSSIGIVSEPSAKETNRRLVLRHGDDNLPVKIPAKISVCDLAELIVLSMTNEKFKKGTGICSSEENKDNRPFESWTELIYKNVSFTI